MSTPRKPYNERVADEVIAALEQGTAPWIKPWEPGHCPQAPTNPVTGNDYRGMNSLFLSMAQPDHDPRFCTYRQAQAQGWQVRKDSHGTPVSYLKTHERKLKTDESGKPLLDKDGEKQYINYQLERPRYFTAMVFHASDIDGIPPLPPPVQIPEEQRHAAAEKLLQASGATILHDQADRAFYTSARDEIHLPPSGQFHSPDGYYATATHELGHWTGHESRLDRKLGNTFGSGDYAREELRAEMFSYMLGMELGIGHDPGQHVAYIGSWVKALQEDPQEIVRAASDAQKMLDFVHALEREYDLQQGPEQGPDAELDTPEVLAAARQLQHNQLLNDLPEPALMSLQHAELTASPLGLAPVMTPSASTADNLTLLYLNPDGTPAPLTSTLQPDGQLQTFFRDEPVSTGLTDNPDRMRAGIAEAVRSYHQEQVGAWQEAHPEAMVMAMTRPDSPEPRFAHADGQTAYLTDNLLQPATAERVDYLNTVTAVLALQQSGQLTGAAVTNLTAGTDYHQANGFGALHSTQDWTGDLEIRPCREVPDPDNPDLTMVEEVYADEDAQFWGLYLQQQDGPLMNVSDHPSPESAHQFADLITLSRTLSRDAMALEAETTQAPPVQAAPEAEPVPTPDPVPEREPEPPAPPEPAWQLPAGRNQSAALSRLLRENGIQPTAVHARQDQDDGKVVTIRMDREDQASELTQQLKKADAILQDVAPQMDANAVIIRHQGEAIATYEGQRGFAPDSTLQAGIQVPERFNEPEPPVQEGPPRPVPDPYELVDQPVAMIKDLNETAYQQAMDQLEDDNSEPERLILAAKRGGTEDQIQHAMALRDERDAHPEGFESGSPYLEQSYQLGIDLGLNLPSEVVQDIRQAPAIEAEQPGTTAELHQDQAPAPHLATEKTWLAIPYDDVATAKAAAGPNLPDGNKPINWDRTEKCWYANPGADLDKLEPWMPDPSRSRQEPATAPEDEFAAVLKDAGFLLDDVPTMDGKKHRVQVEGDKPGQKSGEYVGYLDGHPAGFMRNYRENLNEPWKYSGQTVTKTDRAQLLQESQRRSETKAAERQATHDQTAKQLDQEWKSLPTLSGNHPYLQAKGIRNTPSLGLKQDERGNIVLPLRNRQGELRSLQRIWSTGNKQFPASSEKQGNFHVLGGRAALKNQPPDEPLLICTGFATSATLHQATGKPVIVAFNDSNLKPVAETFKAIFPEREQVILGDDDRHLTERERPLPNAGREAATEAAKAVGGIAAFPAFKQGPNAERTDFNDLQKTEGLKTVEIQLAHVAAIARQKHLNRQQAKEKDKARQDQQEEISL